MPRFTWRLLVCSVAVALVSLGAGTANARSSKSVRMPPNCHASFDPYSYSRAAVTACGYKTFPLESVRQLPGGGASYNYRVNGWNVHFYVPPTGFRPTTATNSQLEEYGLPPRPTSRAALASWRKEMGGLNKPASPPPFLAETHAQADTVYMYYWAGYAVTGSAGTFYHAEAWYKEPTFYSSSCSSTAAVTWAGIGDYYNDGSPIGQDGTGHNVPGLGNHQAWWEVYPYNNITAIGFIYGHPGYKFDASTYWFGSGYTFYVKDYYSGNYTAFREDINHYDGRSAEAIIERPSVNGSHTDLSNFKTMYFTNTEANGKGLQNWTDGNRHGIHMQAANGDDLADPSTIGSDGAFSVSQHHCI